MRQPLSPHPHSPADWVQDFTVTAARSATGLSLRYDVRGDIARLRRGPSVYPAGPSRTDGLWRTTCFEAFVQVAGADGYVELNFAPSGDWAAYAFEGYRAGMTPLAAPAPRITSQSGDAWFSLAAEAAMPQAAKDAEWRVGLCAVLETIDGALSYWALAHETGPPDFHRGETFALVLAPPA